MTLAGVFAVLVGVGMLVQWGISLASGRVAELRTEPIRIGFHLLAEASTAILLIIAGIGLLAHAGWAPVPFYVSMGMLLYTSLVSPGYFAQRGQWGWMGLFVPLVVLAILAVVSVAR